MNEFGTEIIFGVVFVIVIAAAVLAIVLTHRRSEALLQRWAEQNGFQISSSELRWFRRGPFFWTTGRGQIVYYVAVIDTRTGQMRSGWVRCGSWFAGLLSDQTEVRWDESAE